MGRDEPEVVVDSPYNLGVRSRTSNSPRIVAVSANHRSPYGYRVLPLPLDSLNPESPRSGSPCQNLPATTYPAHFPRRVAAIRSRVDPGTQSIAQRSLTAR